MSDQPGKPQDEAERMAMGAERRVAGPEDVPDVEGHLRRQGPERAVWGAEDVAEVEGHIQRHGPERNAFGTEGAAGAERQGIRPEDDPEPADGRRTY